MEPVEEIMARITATKKTAEDNIASFKWELDRNPANSLRWADSVFVSSARLQECDQLLVCMKAVDEGRIELQSVPAEMRRMVGDYLPSQMGDSTSPCSNLMDRARSIVAAEWMTANLYGTMGQAVTQLCEQDQPAR